MSFHMEPWYWAVLGIFLMLLEIILPTFFWCWFGISALIVGGILLICPELSINVQLIIWIISTILLTILWFKYIKPLSIDKTKAGLVREDTIGKVGMVIETGLSHGQIKVRFTIPIIGSDEWLCRSLQPVQVGDRVKVIDIMGNDLLVESFQSSSQNINPS